MSQPYKWKDDDLESGSSDASEKDEKLMRSAAALEEYDEEKKWKDRRGLIKAPFSLKPSLTSTYFLLGSAGGGLLKHPYSLLVVLSAPSYRPLFCFDSKEKESLRLGVRPCRTLLVLSLYKFFAIR